MHSEFEFLHSFFIQNGFPSNLIFKQIRIFIDVHRMLRVRGDASHFSLSLGNNISHFMTIFPIIFCSKKFEYFWTKDKMKRIKNQTNTQDVPGGRRGLPLLALPRPVLRQRFWRLPIPPRQSLHHARCRQRSVRCRELCTVLLGRLVVREVGTIVGGDGTRSGYHHYQCFPYTLVWKLLLLLFFLI